MYGYLNVHGYPHMYMDIQIYGYLNVNGYLHVWILKCTWISTYVDT